MNSHLLTGCTFLMLVKSLDRSDIEYQVDYETHREVQSKFFHKAPRILAKNINGDSFVLNTELIVSITFKNMGSPDHHNIQL